MVFAFAIAAGLRAQVVPCPAEFSTVRERIEKGLADAEAPSCAVAVLRDGQLVWAEGFGLADGEKGVVATPDTPYRAASISKPFTGATLMIAVERGLLDLDQPVNRYLDRPGVVSFAGAADAITLRRLANHTAGLPTHWSFFYPGTAAPDMATTIRHYGFATFAPGTRWNYSNLGFGLLGHVVERVTRTPFGEYMERELLAPLGLTKTSAHPLAAAAEGVAAAYSTDAAGRRVRVAPYDFDHPGASVVCTSANDLARFLRWQLVDGSVDGRRPLAAPSVRALRQPTADRGDGRGYAIGWAIDVIRGRTAFGHTGGMPGVATACRAFPDSKDAYVVLTNTDRRTLCNDVAARIERVLLPESPAPPVTNPGSTPTRATASPPPGTLSPATLAAWRGRFEGTLFLQGTPVPAELVIEDENGPRLRLGTNPEATRLRNGDSSESILVARGELLLPSQEGFPGVPGVELRLERSGARATGLLVTSADRRFNLPHRIELARTRAASAEAAGGGSAASAEDPASASGGPLVIVGGGGTVAAILERALALGGGKEARVVVLPQASGRENAGQASLDRWKALGAADVHLLRLTDPAADRAALAAATMVWFPGGAQSRLMKALRDADLIEPLRARHRAGVVFGGTSAGAAVMSEIMIAALDEGATADDPTPRIETGLGLWPEAIVDQHFTQRRREPRLRLAVARHPNRVGVGIDEKTAVLVRGAEFEVLGEGRVTLVRGQSGPEPEIVVLRAGQRSRLR